jgi:PAS domain S-box-containing protein
MISFLKILILEDSRDDADLIERELNRAGVKYKSSIVNKKDEYEIALKEFRPDVILSDHSLPQFNSIEALKLYKECQNKHNLSAPFILITGAVSEEFAVQCIKAGADDYILKDRLKRLPAAIESALEKTRIENERKKYLEEVIGTQTMMKEPEHLAGLGSWQADLETGKCKWSDETFRIFEYEPGEVDPTLDLLLSHVHPEDIKSLRKRLDQAILNLAPIEGEYRIIDRHGSVKYLYTRVRVKKNPTTNSVALIGFNLDMTEQKQADIQLQKNEQEYKSLFDQNPDAVYSLNLKGEFINVNNSLLKLCGESLDKILNSNFERFIIDEDKERVYHNFYRATLGESQRYEARIINALGKQFTLDVTNMPIVINDRIVGVHGVSKDVTEKQEIQNLLEKVYRLAMIGGWEVDLISGKTSWTDITKELHEVSEDFVPDLDSLISFFKEGESSREIVKAIQLAVEKGKPFDLEAQIITAKGNQRWIRILGDAEFKNEKCTRLYGSFQDIQIRKHAQETSAEASREKITILESIADAFFAVDKEWTITYWNKIAERKFNVHKDEIIGKNLWEQFHGIIDLSFFTQFKEAIQNNKVVHFDEYFAPLNMWVEVSAYPSPSGLSIYIRDVTDLRRYLKEIESQNAKLREIGWIQSHEIRGPLARMMGLVNILGEPIESVDRSEVLNMILTSAHELDSLIRKIVRKTEELHDDVK